MKAVIHTQIRENYGAHDWNGEGECPQYWKCKGGNTFVVHDVTIEDNMSSAWWDLIESSVTEFSDSFEEYIISSDVIDDVDFVETDHRADWDSVINVNIIDDELHCYRETENDGMFNSVIKRKVETWVQVDAERKAYACSFDIEGKGIMSYEAACDYIAQQEAA